ncbi:hypothetical protein SAMN05421827_102247 [Pedobacter terrae]|uniref:Uncharacterized protein n=1 Tax=Pedobacter terrae TaxID=405671 RepID=A0A1G7QBG9_9SPHI|nr:hypothetical protein [Pedobacter terrae]SDF95834.1 hypothetical protein SAMN05421827_102247 [Pedobacter terrae]
MNLSKKTSKSTLINYSKIYFFGIEIAFRELLDYYSIIEDGLVSEKNKRFQNFSKNNKHANEAATDPEYESFLESELASEYMKLDYYFPHNFRASFLIQIFSFVEYELKQICNQHHYQFSTAVSISDLKGSSDLDKAKVYLSKICKIDFNRLQPEWSYLNSLRKIRNRLVHHQGTITHDDPDRKKLLSFISENADVSIKEDLLLNKDFDGEELTIMITGRALNECFLEYAEIFFKKLLEEEGKDLFTV